MISLLIGCPLWCFIQKAVETLLITSAWMAGAKYMTSLVKMNWIILHSFLIYCKTFFTNHITSITIWKQSLLNIYMNSVEFCSIGYSTSLLSLMTACTWADMSSTCLGENLWWLDQTLLRVAWTRSSMEEVRLTKIWPLGLNMVNVTNLLKCEQWPRISTEP